jgi:hypothetical protein
MLDGRFRAQGCPTREPTFRRRGEPRRYQSENFGVMPSFPIFV